MDDGYYAGQRWSSTQLNNYMKNLFCVYHAAHYLCCICVLIVTLRFPITHSRSTVVSVLKPRHLFLSFLYIGVIVFQMTWIGSVMRYTTHPHVGPEQIRGTSAPRTVAL